MSFFIAIKTKSSCGKFDQDKDPYDPNNKYLKRKQIKS